MLLMQHVQSAGAVPVTSPYFRLLTPSEAAKIARISVRILREHVAAGRGPMVTRLGRSSRYFIREDALNRWIEARTAL